MTTLALPTSELVGDAWLKLAVPGVGVGGRLPTVDDTMRAGGFVRTLIVGGDMDRYLPVRRPVLSAQCWWPPSTTRPDVPPWNHAAQLAERIVAGTYDRTLMGVQVDLSDAGQYAPARVHTVIALGQPQRVNDSSNYARFDLDLLLTWTGV